MADHRTAYTVAALALATGDADRDRIIKSDSVAQLRAARQHLFVVDRAIGRALAAHEIDAAPAGTTR